MWPRKQCVLRLGRHACQLWLQQGRQMQWLAQQGLETGEASAPYEPLIVAIQHLVQHVPKRARVQVIADSHWLPVLMLDTGHAPLTQQQIQALATHRFSEARGEAARTWHIMSNYQAGERKALAFACPPQLPQALTTTLAEYLTPDAFTGLQPTLNWAVAQASSKPRASAEHCTVLNEQDRSLMVFTKGEGLLGFHPAAPLAKDAQQLMRDAPLQAWRCGAPAHDWHIHVLAFERQPLSSPGVLTTPQLSWTTLAPLEPEA